MLGSLSGIVVDFDGSSADHVALKLAYDDVGIFIVVEINKAVRWIPTGEGVDRYVEIEARECECRTFIGLGFETLYIEMPFCSSMSSISSGWTWYSKPPMYNRLAILSASLR